MVKKRFWVIPVLSLTFLAMGQAQTERWVYRYNGFANGVDCAYSLVYGSDGNIYAAGESYNSTGNQDFTVISLTSFGTERWIRNFDGLNGDDCARSIIFGSDGNIYVAGYIYMGRSLNDFVVISLAPDGTERWRYHYNTGLEDEAYSVVYGFDGNIYAAGFSGGVHFDFTIISLTPEGAERWVYRYNGSGDGEDVAKAIVFGEDGNIYAAGWSLDSVTGFDFTVISLTAAGQERWVYRYNYRRDWAYSLVYGGDGNIYATGTSLDDVWEEYITIVSLTGEGSQRWAIHSQAQEEENGIYSIIWGESGQIYAAGVRASRFATCRLTPGGMLQWWCYASVFGIAYSINYGSDGYIYVAGFGEEIFDDSDFIVQCLHSNGFGIWSYRYSTGCAFSVTGGEDGNIYAAGKSTGSGTNDDFTVISLNPTPGIKEEFASPVPFLTLSNIGRQFKFSIALPNPATVSFFFYNLTGKKSLSFKVLAPKGTSHHQKDLSALPAGVYILKAELSEKYDTKKCIVLK